VTQAVNHHATLPLDETARSAFDAVVVSTDKFLAKPLQPLRGEKYIDVLGGSLRAVGIDGHRAHDGVRDAGLVQASRQPAHCLVLGTALLKEDADLVETICETEAAAVEGGLTNGSSPSRHGYDSRNRFGRLQGRQ
jgi:hypothetical protein